MFKKTSYQMSPKLDVYLNRILQYPDKDLPELGYSSLEKKVNVRIEASNLKTPLKDVELLPGGFYAGKISLDYLKELSQRDDIDFVHPVPKQEIV